jgi:hypothetical protein
MAMGLAQETWREAYRAPSITPTAASSEDLRPVDAVLPSIGSCDGGLGARGRQKLGGGGGCGEKGFSWERSVRWYVEIGQTERCSISRTEEGLPYLI